MAEYTGLAPLPEDGQPIPIVTFGIGVGSVMQEIDFTYSDYVAYLRGRGYSDDEIREAKIHVDVPIADEAKLYEALGQTLLGYYDHATRTQHVLVTKGLRPEGAPLDHVLQHESSHDRDELDGVTSLTAEKQNEYLERARVLLQTGNGIAAIAAVSELLSLAFGDRSIAQGGAELAILAFMLLVVGGFDIEKARTLYLGDPTEIRAREREQEPTQGHYITFTPRLV